MIGDLIKPGSIPAGNRKRKPRLFARWWVKTLLVLTLVGGLAGGAAFLWMCSHYGAIADTYDLDQLSLLEESSLIYDRNGAEIGSIYVENRRPVSVGEVPLHFIQALKAEEDSRFDEHSGLDYIGIGRAVLNVIKRGKATQGASTITQQLARQCFLDPKDKGLNRKLTEAFLARRIEKNFTKQQILDFYLNRIFFGNSSYGVNAAAIGYFGKPAKELTVSESAVITGLIKSPYYLDPIKFPENSRKQRNHVLNRMREENYITPDDCERLKAEPLVLAPSDATKNTGFVQVEVLRQLKDILNDQGIKSAAVGGFKIHTTVDMELQKATEKSLKENLARAEKNPAYKKTTLSAYMTATRNGADPKAAKPDFLQGAALVLDNSTGAMLAIVGGRDFNTNQYNFATQAHRPAGSAFLPFVYGAAFENGNYPGTRVKDTHYDNRRVGLGAISGILGEWGSEDTLTNYLGDISARKALVYSRLGASLRLGEAVGFDKVRDFAKRAGISSPLKDELKMLIGANEVSLEEMCLAYSAFAHAGWRPKQTWIITSIEDPEGKMIYTHPDTKEPDVKVTDEYAAWQVHSCLAQSLDEGPGGLARKEYDLGDLPAAGKTGTHSGFSDLWFVGYTNRITCGVWAGFDKPGTIYEGAVSSRVVLPVWTDIIKAADGIAPAEPILAPEKSEVVRVCYRSGLRATDGCYEVQKDPETGRDRYVPTTYDEVVKPGYKVFTTCDLHSAKPPQDQAAETPLTAAPAPISSGADVATGADPSGGTVVYVTAPTVLGDFDPYNALKPVLHAVKATPVVIADDGKEVRSAEPVPSARAIEKERSRVQLPPLAPIKLE